MERYESPKEMINGHDWYVVCTKSDRDGRFYWRLFKDGEEHKLEIDSVPQKTPKHAILLAHFFNSGINAVTGGSITWNQHAKS